MGENAFSDEGATFGKVKLQKSVVDSYNRDGCVVIKAGELWSKQERDLILQWSREVVSWPETKGKWWQYFEDGPTGRMLHRIENFLKHHREFARVFGNGGRVVDVVSQLFGEKSVIYKEKINLKLPGGKAFEPHQDYAAGWDMYGHSNQISMLMCIDPFTTENGPLEVVRGEHKNGLLGPKFKPVPEELVREFTWEKLILRPGDVVFFDAFVPHCSASNNSTLERKALYFTYNKASEGDHYEQYYIDKAKTFPPDIERSANVTYSYKI
eukprot:862606_1